MFRNWTNTSKIVSNALPVLEVFRHNLHKKLSIADIERRMKLSHHPAYRKIKLLEREGILMKHGEKYYINLNNDLAFYILEFLSKNERTEFLKKNGGLAEAFKNLAENANRIPGIKYVIIFGSYARREAGKGSDIDIFFVIEKKELEKSQEFLKLLLSQIESMYLWEKIKFSPVFATPEDVGEMVNARKKFIQAIIEEGIIFFGEEIYYRSIAMLLKDWEIWK